MIIYVGLLTAGWQKGKPLAYTHAKTTGTIPEHVACCLAAQDPCRF